MSSRHIVQFFTYAHLPPHLQAVSRPFAELVNQILLDLPDNPEREACLRKLLEAKDCAVRALVARDGGLERVPGAEAGA